MSVFTPISIDEARAFVAPYGVGDIIDFQDIAAGVENSNFFVTTTRGRYVLTIFEKIPRADLDFYMGLMAHLHEAGIGCATPLKTTTGALLGTLKDKPAALVLRLSGGDIAHPTAEDCHAVGRTLAEMHMAAQKFAMPMPNWRGLSWWRRELVGLKSLATAEEYDLLEREVASQADFDHLDLPRGVIHADLFRDNILWDDHDGAHHPQMIDFYFACHDILLWDVAITVNDWCLNFSAYPNADLDAKNVHALLTGYATVRPFTHIERAHWPQMLRAAALRTWLGRLGYHYYQRTSTLTHAKDHPFSERLLTHHIAYAAYNLSLFPESACKS
jgi:homoserine kinase type II